MVSCCQAGDAVCRVVHLRDGCVMVVNGVVDNEAKGRQYREKNQREQSVPEALTYWFLYKHRKNAKPTEYTRVDVLYVRHDLNRR